MIIDSNSNSFQSKTLYIVLIFKLSRLDTNLWICNLCICQKTCQQNTNLWERFWHTENTAEGSSSIPLGLAKETISVDLLCNFCNHPEKGGQMNQKQSASPCTSILATYILKWEKKTSLHLEITSFIYPKKPQKYETRWEQNLALNNEMRMNEMKTKPCI